MSALINLAMHVTACIRDMPFLKWECPLEHTLSVLWFTKLPEAKMFNPALREQGILGGDDVYLRLEECTR